MGCDDGFLMIDCLFTAKIDFNVDLTQKLCAAFMLSPFRFLLYNLYCPFCFEWYLSSLCLHSGTLLLKQEFWQSTFTNNWKVVFFIFRFSSLFYNSMGIVVFDIKLFLLYVLLVWFVNWCDDWLIRLFLVAVFTSNTPIYLVGARSLMCCGIRDSMSRISS